jgi:hypothetical protein
MATTGGAAVAQERSGLMGGVSLGAGTIGFSGATTDPALGIVRQNRDQALGFAMDMYLGEVISPRSALLFDIALPSGATGSSADGEVRVGPRRVTFESSKDTQTSLVMTGAAQFWLTSRVWLRGGLGVGYLHRDLEIDSADLTITLEKGTGVAVLTAAGIEIGRWANSAVNAEFHFTTFALQGLRINAPTVQVGLAWY